MLKRREVLGLLAAISAGPVAAFEILGPVQVREPWAKFRTGPNYRAFVTAIRKLKANRDAASPSSWAFWANIHQSACPHGKPYFLAWHRGYLYLFEKKLRDLAKSETLRLPYWDYFADPTIPIDFTKGNAGDNPLWEIRKGSSVGAALTYGAFDPSVTTFDRSLPNAFEGKIEATPHNNIHNLVGGKMATMQSPQDVLFWLHHANVDRLWTAWVAAGQGRRMLPPGTPYWAGQLEYQTGLAVARKGTISTEALGYSYADLTLPRIPPAPPPAPPIVRSGAPRPPMVGAAPPGAMNAGSQAGAISLGDDTVTVQVPLAAPVPMVMSAAPGAVPRVGAAPNRRPAPPPPADAGPTDISVVLDDVTLTAIGAEGGFFYNVYLNLPGATNGNAGSRLVGTIGPFQIAAATHHGGKARIELPATDLVRELARGRSAAELGALTVSFVRVNADGAPSGTVIGIGGFRIEGSLPQ
jgi:tyrosinase